MAVILNALRAALRGVAARGLAAGAEDALGEVNEAFRVLPLVVVPRDQVLDEHRRRRWSARRRRRTVRQADRRPTRPAARRCRARMPSFSGLVGRPAPANAALISSTKMWRGTASTAGGTATPEPATRNAMPVSLRLSSGMHEADRLGGALVVRDDVGRGRTARRQSAGGRPPSGRRCRVHGRHQAPRFRLRRPSPSLPARGSWSCRTRWRSRLPLGYLSSS